MQAKRLGSFVSKRTTIWKGFSASSNKVSGSSHQLERTFQNMASYFWLRSTRFYTIANNPKTISDSKTDRISLRPDEDRLLTTAFIEAAEILAMARKKESHIFSKKTIQLSPHTPAESLTRLNNITQLTQIESMLDIYNEANAVEGLLRLTSHPRFSSALSKYRELRGNVINQNDVVISLHNAFISVVNWLCHTLSEYPNDNLQDRGNCDRSISLPTKESILLTHVMHLTERSQSLELPLSIPQYQKIAAMIAKHSSSSNISSVLLELSQKVNHIYGEQNSDATGPISSHFFSQALEELLKRDRIADMVELLQGSQEVYKFSVDIQTGTELLAMLKHKVDQCVNNKTPTLFQEADAMDLALILQKPIVDELTIRKQEWENYNNNLDESFGNFLIDEEEDDDDDFESDDNDDDFVDGFDNHTGDKSYNKLSPASNEKFEEIHEGMVKEMIYLRDDTSWQVPDVTAQLKSWNPDKGLFFTKEFEEDLISELIDDEDDDYDEDIAENDKD